MAYFGKYRGIVKEVADPEKRGRIKVECPAVLGKQLSAWALPNLPPNQFSIPSVDTLVWVEFEGGRIDSPIWTGCFYTKEQMSKLFVEAYNPKNTIIVSKNDLVLTPKIKTKMGKVEATELEANKITENDIDVALVGFHVNNGVISSS